MIHRNKKPSPEEIIPTIPEEKSKFTVKMTVEFDFDWNRDFAGQTYSDWVGVFNPYYNPEHAGKSFKKAIFYDLFRQMSDSDWLRIERAALLSADIPDEIERIFSDHKELKHQEEIIRNEKKAEQLESEAKRLKQRAKELKAKK